METRTGSDARLAADIGGTFTDVALEWSGRRMTAKVLTDHVAPEKGVIAAVAQVLEKSGLGYGDIGAFIHGTTLATNALIEKRGAKTALVTTRGFRDVIEIGRESRFDQYDLYLTKPEAIVPRHLRLTLDERIAASGDVARPLDESGLDAIVETLRAQKVGSVAIGFLHSYANPDHENRVAEVLGARLPGLHVSRSSVVCPEIREYERLLTTCANAYVKPIISSYLGRLAADLADLGMGCPVLLMTSGGGLTTLENAREIPIRLVESGPAGGAILAAHVGEKCGERRLLSFDMGGTTAKICLIDDYEPLKSRTFEVARSKRFAKGSGMPIRIPVIEMVEIGTGGGSMARIDEMGQIRVGPQSAGSMPGPASYGRGGTAPTVTDADLVLGKIDPEVFAGGSIRLDAALAESVLDCDIAGPGGLARTTAALGIVEIAEENMANATRVHAAERGKDATDRTLIAFGGAAPLHAARLAEKLGIARVIVPRDAGVGSALGFLRAPVAYELVRSRFVQMARFDPDETNALFAGMERDAVAVVAGAADPATVTVTRHAYVRYSGQGHEIEVDLPSRDLGAGDAQLIRDTFDARYVDLFGRSIPNAGIEVLSWVVVATAARRAGETARPAPPSAQRGAQVRTTQMYDAALRRFAEAEIWQRDAIAPGQRISGPAIIVEPATSTIVTSTFDATLDDHGYIILNAKAAP
ncbi:hydantoinase/oxoprolinase family protein [Oceaniglobus trochenteri]|uniref:hydantoinase/oxoprolinase family protein n=1 Tax=Oceaniglobus trochenteri TaxID=2763260 RepID=UPI001CFFD8AB|nr:hydantoinase/oxoprolinase family protein [Oceaniglobus trochenteri]